MYKVIVIQSNGLAIYQHRLAKDACDVFHASDGNPCIVIHEDKMIAAYNVLGVVNHWPKDWKDKTTLPGTLTRVLTKEEQDQLIKHFLVMLKTSKVKGLSKKAWTIEYGYIQGLEQALKPFGISLPPVWQICQMSGRSILTLQ